MLVVGGVFATVVFCAAMVLLTRGLRMVDIRIREENDIKLREQAKYRRMKKFTEEETRDAQ